MTTEKKRITPIIGVTMGDFNGIGPEVTIKALSQFKEGIFVILGSSHIFNSLNKSIIDVNLIHSISEVDVRNQHIYLYDIFNKIKFKNHYGEVSKEAGKATAACIEVGVKLALNNKIQALVTAPASKQALTLAGYHYPGQTELLAKLTNTTSFAMMLIGGDFRVALITTHCGIADVSSKITKAIILEKIMVVNDSLKRDFQINTPKIAVTSLNPHGGENGLFGDEEQKQIAPAVKKANDIGIHVEGPFPADTLFAKIDKFSFDAYIAMYHDQGLIPLKIKAFGKGVNFTAGLPIVRVSPDHGTAFDIAGKWLADESSMKEAINLGLLLAKKRKDN